MKSLLLSITAICLLLSACTHSNQTGSIYGHWVATSYSGGFATNTPPNYYEDTTVNLANYHLTISIGENGVFGERYEGNIRDTGIYEYRNNALIRTPYQGYPDSLAVISVSNTTLVLYSSIPWGGCQGPCVLDGLVTYTRQ